MSATVATGKKTSLGPNYAWVTAAGGFLTQVGICFILGMLAVNMKAMAEDFGTTPASLAIVSSIFGLTYGGFGFMWGSLADKIGVRKGISLAFALASCCLIVFGLAAKGVASAVAIYTVMGISCAGISTGVIPKLVTTWFAPNVRGRGFTTVCIGGSLAGFVTGIVFPQVILAVGWRGCYIVMGIVMLVCSVIVYLLVRDSPASIGTVPYGTPKDVDVDEWVALHSQKKVELTAEEKAAKKAEDWERIKKVLKMPVTYKFGLVFIFWQFGFMTWSTYLVSSVQSVGFSVVVAGAAYSALKGAQMVGALIAPSVGDKIPRKYVFGTMLTIVGILLVGLIWIVSPELSEFALFAYFCCIGFFSATTPVMQSVLGECYPPSIRGTGNGVCVTISLIGRFFGPILAAATMTAAGFEMASFAFSGVSYIICAILVLTLLAPTGGKYGDPLARKEEEELKAAAKTA